MGVKLTVLIWTFHLKCHMVCLSVILVCYRIICLWLCNRTWALFVPDPVFYFVNLTVLGTSYKWVIKYFSFCVWLISFSMMSSSFIIYVVACSLSFTKFHDYFFFISRSFMWFFFKTVLFCNLTAFLDHVLEIFF